jgi:cell division GTPase FtsZ
MLKAQIIGTGAAGNKAALYLIDQKVVSESQCILINSTNRDIPSGYDGKTIYIGNDIFEGCGKESDEGKKLTLEAMQNGRLDLDTIINPDVDMVIITTSTGGGTGCGSAMIIADYIRNALGINTHVFGFKGLEEDKRELSNTLKLFKSLKENYTTHFINNKDFLQEAGGSYLKAETLANREFGIKVSILLGNAITPSTQNIDRTDLLKLSNNYGYTVIEYKEIPDKLKNVSQFNDFIKSMIDNSKSPDVEEKSQTLMGVIINLPEAECQFVDYSFSVLTDHYGSDTLIEKYKHVQFNEEMPRFVAYICSGMELPITELEEMYERYSSMGKKTDRMKGFLQSMGSLDMGEDEMSMNQYNARTKTSDINQKQLDTKKKAFFNSYELETPNVPNNNNSNKQVKSNSKESNLNKY